MSCHVSHVIVKCYCLMLLSDVIVEYCNQTVPDWPGSLLHSQPGKSNWGAPSQWPVAGVLARRQRLVEVPPHLQTCRHQSLFSGFYFSLISSPASFLLSPQYTEGEVSGVSSFIWGYFVVSVLLAHQNSPELRKLSFSSWQSLCCWEERGSPLEKFSYLFLQSTYYL